MSQTPWSLSSMMIPRSGMPSPTSSGRSGSASRPSAPLGSFWPVRARTHPAKAGAVEFLTKPFRDQDLLDAMQQALERDRVAWRRRAALAAVRQCYARLTPREREVMRLVVAGLLNKQVAAELGTSEIMVKVHRGQVMRKMQAASVADLVRMAAHLRLHVTG